MHFMKTKRYYIQNVILVFWLTTPTSRQKRRLDVVWKLHIMAFNKIFYGKHSKQQRHTFTTRHKSKHYQDEIKERQKSQAKFETRCDQLIMQREYR